MVSNTPSSSNSSFKVSSSSSSISFHDSSTYSSQCSSPSSLLPSSLLQAPTISQSGSKLSVPFLWEVKPGITKQPAETQGQYLSNSSSPTKAASSSYSGNLFYIGKSLEYPPNPLPPPPRLSQAFLSQPRSRDRKLLPTHSLLLRRRPHAEATGWKMSSKEAQEEQDDPFFLAMKACTKVVSKSSGGDLKPEKTGFDGLQAALRGVFKHTNKGRKLSMGSSKEFIQGESLRISEGEPTIRAKPAHPVAARQCLKGGQCRRKYEESDDHWSIKEKISVTSEEGKGRRKGVGISRAMHGSLHALFSQVDESGSKGELRSGSNLHTHILERDKEIPNQRSEQLVLPRKEAHVCHRNVSAGKPSSIGLLGHVHVGVAEKARIQGDPLTAKSSRNDRPIDLDGGRQGIEPNNQRHGYSSKHNAKAKQLININQGHGKPSMQHNPKGFEELSSLNKLMNAKVVEFNSCGAGYNMMNEYSDHHHEQQSQSISSKYNIFSDLLGCRSALPCLIEGASIHPSLIKPFSFHH